MDGRFYDASWAIPDEDEEYLWDKKYPGWNERQEELRRIAAVKEKSEEHNQTA